MNWALTAPSHQDHLTLFFGQRGTKNIVQGPSSFLSKLSTLDLRLVWNTFGQYLLPDSSSLIALLSYGLLKVSCHCFYEEVVETETFRDSTFPKLSRPRPVETWRFSSCWDRDSLRLENLGVVETETDRDWTKVVETETLTRVSLFSELTQLNSTRVNSTLSWVECYLTLSWVNSTLSWNQCWV